MDLLSHVFILAAAIATNAHSVTLLIREINDMIKKRRKWDSEDEEQY